MNIPIKIIMTGPPGPAGESGLRTAPEDHGAIGDGTYHPLSERYATLSAAQAKYPHALALTDSIDWAAFQLAVNLYGPLDGVAIYLSSSTGYRFNRRLYIPYDNIQLLGSGHTKIIRDGDFADTGEDNFNDTIFVTGDDDTGTVNINFGIHGIHLETTDNMSEGAQLHMNGCFDFFMTEVKVFQAYHGVWMQGCTQGFIDNPFILITDNFGGVAGARTGWWFDDADAAYSHPHCGGLFCNNIQVRGDQASTALPYGIRVKGCDGIWLNNGHVGLTTTRSFWVDNLSLNGLLLLFVTNFMFDECLGESLFAAGNFSWADGIHFSACNFKGGGIASRAVNLDTTFKCVGFTISDSEVWQYKLHGIFINDDAQVYNPTFNSNKVRGNGLLGTNNHGGYYIGNGIQNFSIVGGNSGGAHSIGSDPGTQAYGVITGTGCTGIIEGVDLTNNIAGPISTLSPEGIRITGRAQIVPDVDGRTLTEYESGQFFTNAGATGLSTFNLPVAKAGLRYEFAVADTDGIRVVAQGGDTITVGASTSGSGGRIDSTTLYSSVELVALDTTSWIARASNNAAAWAVT